ncbi:molecular chaperone HtpG [Stella humosa]|uniref:Chaperone protein HtpG n=1 Tax=Stella humosa TaxID=94 RepID=A0A3N1LMX2_9PROT|nr:molecular chaperone HtpG [Stella humosa]ROP90555.1 molecular chaperone HtpG [Stella humosa]BBK29550.1 chaperone protein HtpG [Stella humosa]
MSEEQLSFQAETSRLLEIVAHSLYSNRDVFLRELVSNASDACDKLRYLALTDPTLAGDTPYAVTITPDKAARTLTIADTGIGMNRDELVENLGTIARSGTAAFLSQMEKQAEGGGTSLIGQFGVGFYSAFMVADRVEVRSRKAGEAGGWSWSSDGKGRFTIAESADAPERGTVITLHIKEDAAEYLEPARIREIVRTHSDHIALPIRLVDGGKEEQINAASALWTRPKAEVTAEQYKEFYHHVGRAFDDPWLTIHGRAEGMLEYSSLLFVPSTRPFDLFHPERQVQVKLYVRRVFVTDSCAELLPSWLRFVRGMVDSEDLPLNISREMLQTNPVLRRIRQGLVKRILGELARKATDAPEEYATFWGNFGAVVKEGLYEDAEHRDALLGLARFRSTAGDGLVSLAEYAGRMRPGQEAIYTIHGDDAGQLARSPQIEGFRAKGVEVLLLTDPIDEFWTGAVGRHDGKPFRSVTRGGADLAKIEAPEGAEKPEPKGDRPIDGLLSLFKVALGDAVKDVRASERLTDSPVCLVADDGDMDMHLERMLRAARQLDQASPRILEINPTHPLIQGLALRAAEPGTSEELGEVAHLLLDQARILEGEPPADPNAFSRRLAGALARNLAA